MNILITGASGYSGFYIALALRAAGHRVSALLRDTTSARALELLQHEIHLVPGNLRDPASYEGALVPSDVLIHTVLDYDDPRGTDERLLAAIADVTSKAPRRRRLVYMTGCSLYGKVPELIMDETTAGNPAHGLHFRVQLENQVLGMSQLQKVVVRPGFMYGHSSHHSVADRWFQMGEEGKAVYYGDRNKGWSWIHIADLADAMVRIVEHDAAIDGEIFCLADEQRPRCIDVMTACVQAVGFRGEIEFAPIPKGDWTLAITDQNEFITSQKARRLLGWTARHPGILDDIDTYYRAWKAAKKPSPSNKAG